MGRSQESFGKKEVRNKREKKRKAKEQKRVKKKNEGKKNSFEDMIAYVNEFGVITDTPPDPDNKQDVDPESIELSATKNTPDAADFIRKGVITFFNESKGFGFIRDLETGERVFVHVNNLQDHVSENDVVAFETGKGQKGPIAMKVRLFTEEEPKNNESTD